MSVVSSSYLVVDPPLVVLKLCSRLHSHHAMRGMVLHHGCRVLHSQFQVHYVGLAQAHSNKNSHSVADHSVCGHAVSH